jgi:hypothetical protein
MADENPAETPPNIRILYVGPAIVSVRCGDVLTRAHLASLGVAESELLGRGEAELTADPATVEPDVTPADIPATGEPEA